MNLPSVEVGELPWLTPRKDGKTTKSIWLRVYKGPKRQVPYEHGVVALLPRMNMLDETNDQESDVRSPGPESFVDCL